MTVPRPTFFTCTFCGRKIEVGETRLWSEGISIVAKHVSVCDRVPQTATSSQRSLAINEMARAIVDNPPTK
jgi:hypothetical protein